MLNSTSITSILVLVLQVVVLVKYSLGIRSTNSACTTYTLVMASANRLIVCVSVLVLVRQEVVLGVVVVLRPLVTIVVVVALVVIVLLHRGLSLHD